jgi:hypothetical protein
LVDAEVYLPDSEDGYYRGTRFDWAGVIGSLTCASHSYFGPWREEHDPYKHDSITGPAEEFYAAGEPDIDYPFVAEGDAFLRLGVGLLCKKDSSTFERFHTYAFADTGQWHTSMDHDCVEFEQQAISPSGLGYVYKKAVRLVVQHPILLIEHSLVNVGSRDICTRHYNHNFLTIDQQPTGPGFEILLPYAVRAAEALNPLQVRGQRITFDRMLTAEESVLAELTGYGASASDYDITVIHRDTGAAVRIRADRPLVKLLLWAKRQTLCPEPYIDIALRPGEHISWTISYHFYEV